MNEKEVYTNSILTFAFTNDGRVIVRHNKEEKLDTLPWIFMGYHEQDYKKDYEDSIWVMNHIDDYKEEISSFFTYHFGNSRHALLERITAGNNNKIVDVGELHKDKEFAKNQIKEMKNFKQYYPYIRVDRVLYDSGTNQSGQQIINRIETRYIVLPCDEDIEDFPKLEAIELDELKEKIDLLSDKIIVGITDEEGKIMESFINQLKSSDKNKAGSPKK